MTKEPQIKPQTAPVSRIPREPTNALPSLADWLAKQLGRGNAERFELLQLSATSNPRIVEEYDPPASPEAPGVVADLARQIWERAIDDSHNSVELGALFYGVQSFVTHGTGSGALKKFTVPPSNRVDGRPLEQPNPEGVLAGSMRHLQQSHQAANLFALEMAKQTGDAFDRAQLSFVRMEENYRKQLESLIATYERTLEWKDKELQRYRDRTVELEGRALENFRLSEELHGEKFERDIRALKAAHAEERKNQVASHVVSNILPLVTKRLGGMLGNLGGGAAGDAGASSASSSSSASSEAAPAPEFNAREQAAIRRFLGCLDLGILSRLQSALAGTPAEQVFADLIQVLFEEGERRDQAEAAAAAARAAGANGAADHMGGPSA